MTTSIKKGTKLRHFPTQTQTQIHLPVISYPYNDYLHKSPASHCAIFTHPRYPYRQCTRNTNTNNMERWKTGFERLLVFLLHCCTGFYSSGSYPISSLENKKFQFIRIRCLTSMLVWTFARTSSQDTVRVQTMELPIKYYNDYVLDTTSLDTTSSMTEISSPHSMLL